MSTTTSHPMQQIRTMIGENIADGYRERGRPHVTSGVVAAPAPEVLAAPDEAVIYTRRVVDLPSAPTSTTAEILPVSENELGKARPNFRMNAKDWHNRLMLALLMRGLPLEAYFAVKAAALLHVEQGLEHELDTARAELTKMAGQSDDAPVAENFEPGFFVDGMSPVQTKAQLEDYVRGLEKALDAARSARRTITSMNGYGELSGLGSIGTHAPKSSIEREILRTRQALAEVAGMAESDVLPEGRFVPALRDTAPISTKVELIGYLRHLEDEQAIITASAFA